MDSSVALAKTLKAGLPLAKLLHFQKVATLPWRSIAAVLQLPPRTLARRKAAGRLNQDESERLLRLALLFDKATELFEGDRAGAAHWLQSPCKALGQLTPLELAETEIGAREVEDLIGRLEFGVYS
jgi:putative toxin-antitoxin system antitoxin component (TIGR02293 family)